MKFDMSVLRSDQLIGFVFENNEDSFVRFKHALTSDQYQSSETSFIGNIIFFAAGVSNRRFLLEILKHRVSPNYLCEDSMVSQPIFATTENPDLLDNLSILIAEGANVNCRASDRDVAYLDHTPLMLAIIGENVAAVKLLLAAGADSNYVFRKQGPMLVKHGALMSADKVGRFGINGLMLAALKGGGEIFSLLRGAGATASPADVEKRLSPDERPKYHEYMALPVDKSWLSRYQEEPNIKTLMVDRLISKFRFEDHDSCYVVSKVMRQLLAFILGIVRSSNMLLNVDCFLIITKILLRSNIDDTPVTSAKVQNRAINAMSQQLAISYDNLVGLPLAHKIG
jgi:ankyrin repeat protein